MSDDDRRPEGPEISTHAGELGDRAAAGGGSTILPADQAASVASEQALLPMAIPEPARRGPGKPQGAVNKRTNTVFQIAVDRYGDPLIGSVAIGNMPTKELITYLRELASDCGIKLGATVMDVVRFQEECRRNAMPYGHSKRAPVNDKGETVLPLIGIGTVVQNARQVVVTGHSVEDRVAKEAKTIQHVSEDDDDQSHGE